MARIRPFTINDWSDWNRCSRITNYPNHDIEPEKILIEHTSANPTGPFHMGRARNPIIGDSVARLLTYYGHLVNTEYYVNDTGRQAATLAHGLANYRTKEQGKIDHKLVECYRKASDKLKNETKVRDEIYAKMELIENGDKIIIDSRNLEYIKKNK